MKHLKLTITVFMIALGTSVASAQKCSVYNKYEEKEKVQSVFISKAMLEMQPNLYTNDVYIGKVAGQLDAVYVLTSLDDKVKKELRSDILDYIKKGKYEVLMKQKGMVSTSSFYVKRKGEKVQELIMYTDGTAKLTFVHLFGEMTSKDIQRITNYQKHSDNKTFFTIPDFAPFYGQVQNIDLSGLDCLKDLDVKLEESLKNMKGFDELKSLDQFNQWEGLEEKIREQLSNLGIM